MSDLNTLPEVVNIDHYSGDTLPIHILISDTLIAGRTFFAHVRKNRSSRKIDAVFSIVLTADGADLVLSSEQCLDLTTRGNYSGVWDVQLAEADGSDPVQTLATGAIELHQDVTRVSA